MSDIKWEDGAVCFGNGKQWYTNEGGKHGRPLVNIVGNEFVSFDFIIGSDDFQLNEIKQGDYIEAPELDAEQKYNDAVEVLGLFEVEPYLNRDIDKSEFITHAAIKSLGLIADSDGDLVLDYDNEFDIKQRKRKLTYPQLMAIGKLKRAMIERDSKYGPNEAPELTPELTPDAVNKPSHYQFFEGIEVIEIIASSMTREQFKGYCLGNRIKYRLRAGNKDDIAQELAKSDKYVELYDEHKHLCK